MDPSSSSTSGQRKLPATQLTGTGIGGPTSALGSTASTGYEGGSAGAGGMFARGATGDTAVQEQYSQSTRGLPLEAGGLTGGASTSAAGQGPSGISDSDVYGARAPTGVKYEDVTVTGHGAAVVQPMGEQRLAAQQHERQLPPAPKDSATRAPAVDHAATGADYGGEPDVVPTLGSRGMMNPGV
jgi:hypothetical protein